MSLQRSKANSFLHISFGLILGDFCKRGGGGGGGGGGRCAAKMHITPYNPWPSLAHFIESRFDKKKPFMTTIMAGLIFSFALKMPTG